MIPTDNITRVGRPNWHTVIATELRNRFAKELRTATPDELFRATAGALRPALSGGLLQTEERFQRYGAKSVYYLSLEFLLGRSLSNNLQNLQLYDQFEQTLGDLGWRLADILEQEPDAPLGNGGLGRLAACFLDSLASLHLPGYGYGINYEYGLFRQEIENGHQVERPDYWASGRSPWLIEHLDQACAIPVYGHVEHAADRHGGYNPMWLGWQVLIGVPHDLPIVGRDGLTINFLRLFSARASNEFDMGIFSAGDYWRAVKQKIESETVSKVLYPSDSLASGKELRLIQEYFLVACSLRDILRRFRARCDDVRQLARHVAIQLNDTHPALMVAELMRMLVDEHNVPWEESWEITQATCGYTNHTLMPEALEKWPTELVQRVLPRHLQIIYEINHRFLGEVAQRWPEDPARLGRMSLIEEGPSPSIRMAHLSIIGSHAVNGVASLHTELVKQQLVPDFHEFYPNRFTNKTNGVTPRRWLEHCNPTLRDWITERIGTGWKRDFAELRQLDSYATDSQAQCDFRNVKQHNKARLVRLIAAQTGLRVNPGAMFDVQVKRIHEYKRQLLHVLGIIDEYLRIVDEGARLPTPRLHLFAGKAAPGYAMAKLIIKLIHNVGQVIAQNTRAAAQIQVVFLPDYKVSQAEVIIPGADLSEQISTAGTEASGTGNMKFAINGALTIGTLDGANIEMREEVGVDNIFIFGHTTAEVRDLLGRGYLPAEWREREPRLRRVLDALDGDRFSLGEPGLFDPICRALLKPGEPYLHLADFGAYAERQEQVSEVFTNPCVWTERAIYNVARMGKFSSDRSIAEYAREIWGITGVVPIPGRRTSAG